MHRYFVRLQYKGSNYSGWQFQPNAITVQECIETCLNKILGSQIRIVGCGRTDAGVHASDYYFHFDSGAKLPHQFKFKLNMMLPKDISFTEVFEVTDKAHARFDAMSRSYEYRIHKNKTPFNIGLSYYYPHLFSHDLAKLNEMASLFLAYDDFYTFCKANTDVKTTKCQLTRSEWLISDESLTFHITADRFLRGMVRLVVGCCINYALGKISIDEVQKALTKRERLRKDLSVPAEGLYLCDIIYPDAIHREETVPYND